MLFSLKIQRDNRQNALTVDPAKGKTGKRPYFHRTVEMKQPHTITEPKKYTGAAAGRKRFRAKGTKCKKDGSFRKSARPFYAMAGNKGVARNIHIFNETYIQPYEI